MAYAKNNLITQEKEDKTTITNMAVTFFEYNESGYPVKGNAQAIIYDKINNTHKVLWSATTTNIYEKETIQRESDFHYFEGIR